MVRLPDDERRAALEALAEHGSYRKAAEALGMPPSTFQGMVARARSAQDADEAGFSTKELPSALPTIDELRTRRRAEFARVHAAKEARRLIDVAVRMDGPVGIAHFGDPHIDDPGMNIVMLERHIDLVSRTSGLFAANIGDMTNNWVGRIAHLYGEQSTSAAEAWMLCEWMMKAVPWLYVIGGNHDVWSGAGDPLKWIMRTQSGIFENHGVRLNMQFPNGREVRVNARHDFKGHSMWNATHGVAKAAQMGWRDQILIAGHLHISGYQVLKDPATGMISHAIRVASYKWHDRYADQLGLPDQNITENVVTIINPDAESERQLVTVFLDPEFGADVLTFMRRKHAQAKRVSV